MKAHMNLAAADDAILSTDEADAALDAWTLDELDDELQCARSVSDEPGA
jgi:hypothetical protein